MGLLLCTTAAWTDELPRLHTPGVPGERMTRLVVPREITVLYKALAELPLLEQRRLLLEISPAVKAQLWAYNLHLFVLEHRGLPQAQRDVIDGAIDLLASPGLFDPFEFGSPQFRERQTALALQKQAVRTAFAEEALYPLFMRLGPEPPPSEMALQASKPKPASGLYYCECQVTSGYAPECGNGVCQPDGIPMCTPWMGCGYWALESCDGMCR
jgi:hypothetical protein